MPIPNEHNLKFHKQRLQHIQTIKKNLDIQKSKFEQGGSGSIPEKAEPQSDLTMLRGLFSGSV